MPRRRGISIRTGTGKGRRAHMPFMRGTPGLFQAPKYQLIRKPKRSKVRRKR